MADDSRIDGSSLSVGANEAFKSDYSDDKFLRKLVSVIPLVRSKQGGNLISTVMQLFYLAKSPGIPLWVKGTVVGALGYFIVIPDAVPDITPFVGFVDDLAVLATALAAVAPYISPALKKRVEEMLVSLRIRPELTKPMQSDPTGTQHRDEPTTINANNTGNAKC